MLRTGASQCRIASGVEEPPVTRAQAKKIYSDVKALVYVFGGNIRKKCLERGVPEAMVDELLANDTALNNFLDHHDFLGDRKDDD
jgi:hypothetical protein